MLSVRYPSSAWQYAGDQHQDQLHEALLFDEPTSALDPELLGVVLKTICSLAEEGRTMLVVTHEMGFARDASSRVIFLHQGRVEEDGIPQDVFVNTHSERGRQFIKGHNQ